METKIDHAKTLQFLIDQGYPMEVIRVVLPKLAGWKSHKDIARVLGTHRSVITNHLNMVKYRQNDQIQQGICQLLGVPVEEFFGNEKTPITDVGLHEDRAAR